MTKIAFFDDEAANLEFYKDMLSREFAVDTFQNPYSYKQALKNEYSAIIIDVLMPGLDGLQLYQEILKHDDYNHCPILFISADGSEETRLKSLNVGGIDFIQKMMKQEEVILRLRNKISYFQSNRTQYRLGSVKLDTKELKVYFKDKLLDLTLIELKLLKYLIKHHPQLSSREDICQFIWPDQYVQQTTLNTHLSNLRNKLADWEFEIVSVKFKGIQLAAKTLQ